MASDSWPLFDVVVVGGGSAGFASAIGAARAGARVLLLERYGFLGGMATAGMVGTICGLYPTGASGPPLFLNDGFAAEFSLALSKGWKGEEPERFGKTHVLPYAPFAFSCLADELTGREKNLTVRLHSRLIEVQAEDRLVKRIRFAGWDRTEEVNCSSLIDCTGDANAAFLCGHETESPPLEERQLPSLVFHLQGVDTGALSRANRTALLRSVHRAEEEGRVEPGISNFSLRASARPGEVVVKLALSGVSALMRSRPESDLMEVDFMTAVESEARDRAQRLARFLVSESSLFRSSFISHVAPQVGIREGRRAMGRYRLTRNDVLQARKFDDGIARAAWPIELWEDDSLGAKLIYLPDQESYHIPFRSLRLRDLDNMFVAGRCLDASHEAHGSARVIGTCLATGETLGKIVAGMAESKRWSDSISGVIHEHR